MAAMNCLVLLIVCVLIDEVLPQPACIQSKCDLSSSPSLQLDICECDNECILYKDCCLDYSPTNVTYQPSSALYELMECLEVNYTRSILSPGGNSVWMVSRCPQPSEHSEKCTDQSLFLPVTDSRLNFTFRNVYCAMCNNVTMEQLELWQPQFYCSDQDVSNFFSNIFTFEEIKSHCFIHDIVLEGSYTRSCIPHINTCPTNSNVDLKQDCIRGPFDLKAVLAGNSTRLFKNSACAKCNGILSPTCLFQGVDTDFASKPGKSALLSTIANK